MPNKTEQPTEEKAPVLSGQVYLINLENGTSVSVSASSVEEAITKAKAVKE
jgi:hypothetical protein